MNTKRWEVAMKGTVVVLAAVLAAAPVNSAHAKDEFGTRAEAEGLVKKAVAHIKSVGKDKAYAEFTEKKAGWVDRDLYVVVYGMDGKGLAHGQNAKMVGKDLIELKDADGKPFVKERTELAAAKGKFWQEYKFTDPVSKKVMPKEMYCERVEDAISCVGVYKR
jgi:cytochrome c